MNKTILTILISALFLISGCESTKSEVAAKKYNLIVHNVSSTACSSMVIGYIADEFGYSDANFHQDNDRNVSCGDYGKTEGDDCEVTDLTSDDEGYGKYSCVIGTDKRPTKGDLANSYMESMDITYESKENLN